MRPLMLTLGAALLVGAPALIALDPVLLPAQVQSQELKHWITATGLDTAALLLRVLILVRVHGCWPPWATIWVISYSIKDRKLAKQTKKCLLTYGLNVFLAHDDIEASAQWANVILAKLKESEVFLPLLTKAFRASRFTDQETGIAVAHGKRKLIIPLKVDLDPYGFIGAIQAQRLDADSPTLACTKIAKIIGKNPERQQRFLDGLLSLAEYTNVHRGRLRPA